MAHNMAGIAPCVWRSANHAKISHPATTTRCRKTRASSIAVASPLPLEITKSQLYFWPVPQTRERWWVAGARVTTGELARHRSTHSHNLPQTLIGYSASFVYFEGPDPHPRPLLLLRGWPEFIRLFRRTIGSLGDPVSACYDACDSSVIAVASLPEPPLTTAPLKATHYQPTQQISKLLRRPMTRGTRL